MPTCFIAFLHGPQADCVSDRSAVLPRPILRQTELGFTGSFGSGSFVEQRERNELESNPGPPSFSFERARKGQIALNTRIS